MNTFTSLLALALAAAPALAQDCSTPGTGAGKVQFAGVNIAGFDFGCTTDGTCLTDQSYPPLGGSNPDGASQMTHFVNEGLNVFRLPVGWQYLANNNLGSVDEGMLGNYDQLVQSCLSTGAHCIVDIHNYARWNGAIIGQGGPTNDQFVSLWTQLATKYASEANIIFGVMNEPHELDLTLWAETVQQVVTAIRGAGATSQTILLPGTDYASAGGFANDGSSDALSGVTNPDGSFDNLVFDVHQYMDSDFSGTNAECVTNNIDDAFTPLAQWLRCNNRKAFLTETGGGNVQSCATYMCQQLDFLNQNSDVFLGWVGWAAGSFDPTTYALSEVPNSDGTDTLLTSTCIVGKFTT